MWAERACRILSNKPQNQSAQLGFEVLTTYSLLRIGRTQFELSAVCIAVPPVDWYVNCAEYETSFFFPRRTVEGFFSLVSRLKEKRLKYFAGVFWCRDELNEENPHYLYGNHPVLFTIQQTTSLQSSTTQ